MSDHDHDAHQILIQAYGDMTVENVYNFLRNVSDLNATTCIRLADFMGAWYEASLEDAGRAQQYQADQMAKKKLTEHKIVTPDQATKDITT